MDRVRLAERTAMTIAREYEVQVRGAVVTDVSAGDGVSIARFLAAEDVVMPTHLLSADLVSLADDGLRLIEVKGRGSKGPVKIPERQFDTFESLGKLSWLYAVWNTTQPGPFQMTAVCDPARLPWVRVPHPSPATRKAGGVASEDTFVVPCEAIEALGTAIDLSEVQLLD